MLEWGKEGICGTLVVVEYPGSWIPRLRSCGISRWPCKRLVYGTFSKHRRYYTHHPLPSRPCKARLSHIVPVVLSQTHPGHPPQSSVRVWLTHVSGFYNKQHHDSPQPGFRPTNQPERRVTRPGANVLRKEETPYAKPTSSVHGAFLIEKHPSSTPSSPIHPPPALISPRQPQPQPPPTPKIKEQGRVVSSTTFEQACLVRSIISETGRPAPEERNRGACALRSLNMTALHRRLAIIGSRRFFLSKASI